MRIFAPTHVIASKRKAVLYPRAATVMVAPASNSVSQRERQNRFSVSATKPNICMTHTDLTQIEDVWNALSQSEAFKLAFRIQSTSAVLHRLVEHLADDQLGPLSNDLLHIAALLGGLHSDSEAITHAIVDVLPHLPQSIAA